MKDRAIVLLGSQGVEAAIEVLQAGKTGFSPAEQVQMFDEVLRHAYWKGKDLPGAIRIGQAGIAHGESLAADHPDQTSEINSQVKAIHYNLASFTWPGWDEPGFVISTEQVQLGLESARHNLDLAIELKKDALPLSRAYWMLAAQEMAVEQYPSAVGHFSQAEALASQAGAGGEALLSRGFGLLANLFSDPDDEESQTQLETVKAALATEENGEFFIKQIEDARRVFGP
ncbi:MAG: hypothetical protein GWN27_14155 [candidate division Zixibacteria bacterium]|nr:hypothetical protein [candidate division Zixibacteria bacterium]